jgi:dihydroxyacetone kinase
VAVERCYVGSFLTALEMAGVSLSVIALDDARLARLDATTDAPAWPNAAARPRTRLAAPERVSEVPAAATPARPRTPLGTSLEAGIRAIAQALIEAEPHLTELDRAVGDGDLGISLARGARAILDALPRCPLDDPAATLHALGLALQRAMGGTSGPLYAVFLLRAAGRLKAGPGVDPRTWAEAFQAGCRGIAELGGASDGDRTMLDALNPAARALEAGLAAGESVPAALASAAAAAEAGARATAGMSPRRGRSSYLGERTLGHIDPGAEAVAIWLRALA